MKRMLIVLFTMFLIGCIVLGSLPVNAASSETENHLVIATLDNRPLSVDRLVFTAFSDIGMEASFETFAQTIGYEMANSGEIDGAMSALSDMDQTYPDLIKISTPVTYTSQIVYTLKGSGLDIKTWDDLSGLTVACLANRVYISNHLPKDAVKINRESVSTLFDSLQNGACDAVVLMLRTYETVSVPDGIEHGDPIDSQAEYLYLNKKHESMVPEMDGALRKLFGDGRGENILKDISEKDIGSPKRILHIISASTEVSREQRFIAEIRNQFADDESIEWLTFAFYAGRYKMDDERRAYYARQMREDYISKDIAAIIVSGDEAFEFIKDYYFLLFRNIPVFFYDVCEDRIEDRTFNRQYFTGLAKHVSADETINVALRLFPDTKEIYVLNDYTMEGEYYRKNMGQQLSVVVPNSVSINDIEDLDLKQLTSLLKELPQDSLLFVGSYFRDANGQYYSQNEMKRIIENNCSAPVFTLYSADLAYSAVGGKCPDYTMYADVIGGMLRQVFSGVSVSNIPIANSSEYNRWVFDKLIMSKFNISEKSLPTPAQVINKIPTIWESNPKFAIALIGLFVAGIMIAAGLSVFITIYRKQQELLQKDAKINEVKLRLERIIDASPVSFLITIDGKIIEINENMKYNTGLDVGDYAEDVYIEKNERKSIINRMEKNQSITNHILQYRYHDGSVHRAMVNYAPIEYDGQAAVVIWAMDIEELELKKDELRDAHKSLQTVMDTMPVPVRMVDMSNDKIIYANNSCLELFEYDSFEEIARKRLSDMLPKYQSNGIPSSEKIAELKAAGEKPISMQVEYITANGKIIDAHLDACLISYNGQPASIGIIRDYADIKELAKTRQSLRTVLDTLPIPIRLFDMENNKIIYANKAAFRLFQVEQVPDILDLGMFGDAYMPVTQPDGTDSMQKLRDLSQPEPTTAEIVCFKQNGELFDAQITSCLIDYDEKKVSLGIMTDLTAEKEYQRRLIDAAEKEKEANQLKSRFLVNMSHEIRTPMNAIIGLTEIELRKVQPNDVYDIYKKINNSAKNLLTIVNDILDLSKIEADKIELYDDEIELEEVVDSALLVATPRLDGKNVEFLLNASLGLPRFIRGDRTRLWQILKNFLDNSAKYTDVGKIVLTIYENREQSDNEKVSLTFLIEDTGIGMNEEQIESLFLPYYQIHNEAQKKYTGTGLGMAISKHLCELMGGTLRIDSESGKGTKVYLNIPFNRSQNVETEIQAVKSPELDGLHILAVDDDDLSLSLMSEIINGSGALCELAHSGEEAMTIIFEHRERGKSFDVILLDYMMDGINGLETAKQIKTGLSIAPRLLMVTAYQKLLLKKELESSNIEDVIEKPFIPSKFIHKILSVLGFRKNNVENEKISRFENVSVLLCEDYPINSEVAIGMFAQFGIQTTVAENGKEGIEILNSGQTFDLIFMDLQMPVMNGYEATRIIRSDKRFDEIPVISLTADAMKEIIDQCKEAGMDDYIAKPIDFTCLQKIFLKWLPESKRVSEEGEKQKISNASDEGLPTFSINDAFYEKLRRKFAEDLPDHWLAFEAAVSDMDQTRKYIHKLKGASGNLSLRDIYEYLVAFEISLKNNNPDKGLYDKIIKESELLKRQLTGYEEEDKKTEVGTAAEFKQYLNSLEASLLDYDMHKSMDAVEHLEKKTWPMAEEDKLTHLCGLVTDFEYETALDVLRTMEVPVNE